jgi:uncharacterized protein YutE (UPF0331/DUF86 family)
MSNTQRLLTRIGALRDNLQRVREGLQDADDATLLRDPWRLAAIKWHLLLAIEDAFALCNQTIAILGGDAPTAYAECFEKLAAHGVIDSALAERLKAMARFRNLLATPLLGSGRSACADDCPQRPKRFGTVRGRAQRPLQSRRVRPARV